MDATVNIAKTIADQIGRPALFMMGAKNLINLGEKPGRLGGLVFKVMRNTKKVTHVEILLTDDDLYTVNFIKVYRAPSCKTEVLTSDEGVYVDMLHAIIADGTGLALSL